MSRDMGDRNTGVAAAPPLCGPTGGAVASPSPAKPAAANAYRIEGPALISFSGGRTSGYMLWHILDAYDGKLPEDVHVCFANTGKEREETLRFVHDCATHWGVRVRWLEWKPRPKGREGRLTPLNQRFEEVGYNSASRNGEPFEALIQRKGFAPNSVTRFCTSILKIETMHNFMRSQGHPAWSNVVGLRWDEMHRVFKSLARNEAEGRSKNVTPLAMRATMVTRKVVEDWWSQQPFNLAIKGWQGNCDLCFLKGRRLLQRTIRDEPERAVWWDRMEKTGKKGRFRSEYSYEDMVQAVASSPLLPLEDGDGDEFDAECGLWCSGEAA